MNHDSNDRLPQNRPLARSSARNRFTIPQPLFPTRSKTSPRGERQTAAGPGRPTKDARTSTANLWVNQIGDRIVGMVRLADAGPATARIVAFRVDPEFYRTAVVTGLMRAVIDHCRLHGYSRVLVGFHVAPPWMPSILTRHGFRVFWRRRTWEAVLEDSSPGQ